MRPATTLPQMTMRRPISAHTFNSSGLIAAVFLAGLRGSLPLDAPPRRTEEAMLSLSFSAAMLGIEGYVVRVEADSAPGPRLCDHRAARSRARRSARARTRRDLQLRIRLSGGTTARQSLARRRAQSGSGIRSRDRARADGIDEQIERHRAARVHRARRARARRQASARQRHISDGARRAQRRLYETDRSDAQRRRSARSSTGIELYAVDSLQSPSR